MLHLYFLSFFANKPTPFARDVFSLLKVMFISPINMQTIRLTQRRYGEG